MWKRLIWILPLLFIGCAQPPTNKYVKQTTHKTDFGSGIDLAVSYHQQSDGSIIVADASNLRNRTIRLWLVHLQEMDGQRISRAIRYYEGADKTVREVFRVPPIESGLTETFWTEAFGPGGELLIKSEPITNQSDQTTEGTQ